MSRDNDANLVHIRRSDVQEVKCTQTPVYIFGHTKQGVAKVRKEASFRERKVPFAKGRFCLRKEDIHGKYLNILHIVLILMFVLNGIQAN